MSEQFSELATARQRIQAYRDCGHPVIPSAVWLLAEVDRLTTQNAKLLSAENACDERMRKAAKRTGVFAHDGKAWPECEADEIAQLRDALQELCDWQNGPPLFSKKWRDGWGVAMKKAKAVLESEA